MARIDYCDTSKSSERTKEILGKNRNANIFRMMAHSPSYFEQYCRLGGAIRHKGELDPVVRELAITRTGSCARRPMKSSRTSASARMSGSPTSRTRHWKTGSPPPASTRCSAPRWPSPTRSSSCNKPTDATFKAIAARLTPAALVELQLSVGFYIMTSKFLETFGIDMQPVAEVVS